MKRLLLAIAGLVLLGGLSAATAQRAEACAFARPPTTYEAGQDRAAYLLAVEVASYNLLFPEDAFFGTPTVEMGTRENRRAAQTPYIPATLLKANGWIESGLTMSDRNTPFDAVGPALVSFDCGHGIMQITSGMTSPEDGGYPSARQALIASHYLYNVARGAAILVDKWNGAPEVRPIAGTDTDGDPRIVENWYFATWSYNGFTGPGANRSNHPMDPRYAAWPRTGFSCGAVDDGYGHSYGNYPYQEIVFGCAARPPSVLERQLWPPLPVSLPDLNDPLWRDPLELAHFTTSDWFARMDIPSPQPIHYDDTQPPGPGTAAYLLASPALRVSPSELIGQRGEVTIRNLGSGILAWRAKPEQPWITVDKQGGVALSGEVYCGVDAPCERSATLTISIDATAAPPTREDGWVRIESLTTGQVWRVRVVRGDWPYRIGVPGTIAR